LSVLSRICVNLLSQKIETVGNYLCMIFYFRLRFHVWLRCKTLWKTNMANMTSSVRDVCDSVLSQIPRVRTTLNPEYRKILCVGLACVDSIYVVKTFPVEDTDVR